jgi:electron transfer flavoprotein beta subunit
MLGIPSVNVVTKIDVENGVATMERDIDGGREKLSCKLPLVASAQKELTEPRIPNMRGIMAARTKPLTVVEPTSGDVTSLTVGFDLPAAKGGVKLIPADQAEQLIDLLHNEAKVI